MGSSATKPESSDNEDQLRQGPVFKTSIYGWGKLKYPAKKKIKNQNVEGPSGSHAIIAHNSPKVSQQSSRNSPQAKIEAKQNVPEQISFPKRQASPINQHPIPQANPAPSEPKIAKHEFLPEIKIDNNRLKQNTFYGQYRCKKCNKYWRSAHSQEGISQNCSKCGTPTLPQK